MCSAISVPNDLADDIGKKCTGDSDISNGIFVAQFLYGLPKRVTASSVVDAKKFVNVGLVGIRPSVSTILGFSDIPDDGTI